MTPKQSPSQRALATASAAEIVTLATAAQGHLPLRKRGQARDPVQWLAALLAHLVDRECAIDKLAFRKGLEARAANSVSALAYDLACYAAFCDREGGRALPASEPRVVAYIEHLENKGFSTATARRRISSIATVHSLIGEL